MSCVTPKVGTRDPAVAALDLLHPQALQAARECGLGQLMAQSGQAGQQLPLVRNGGAVQQLKNEGIQVHAEIMHKNA